MGMDKTNRVIDSLNTAAAALLDIAQAIHDEAWDGIEDEYSLKGPRPNPVLEVIWPKTTHTEQPPAEPQTETAVETLAQAPGVKPVELAQVRSVLAGLSQAGFTDRVRELIQAAGANRLSEVDPDKYGWLLEQAKQVQNAR